MADISSSINNGSNKPNKFLTILNDNKDIKINSHIEEIDLRERNTSDSKSHQHTNTKSDEIEEMDFSDTQTDKIITYREIKGNQEIIKSKISEANNEIESLDYDIIALLYYLDSSSFPSEERVYYTLKEIYEDYQKEAPVSIEDPDFYSDIGNPDSFMAGFREYCKERLKQNIDSPLFYDEVISLSCYLHTCGELDIDILYGDIQEVCEGYKQRFEHKDILENTDINPDIISIINDKYSNYCRENNLVSVVGENLFDESRKDLDGFKKYCLKELCNEGTKKESLQELKIIYEYYNNYYESEVYNSILPNLEDYDEILKREKDKIISQYGSYAKYLEYCANTYIGKSRKYEDWDDPTVALSMIFEGIFYPSLDDERAKIGGLFAIKLTDEDYYLLKEVATEEEIDKLLYLSSISIEDATKYFQYLKNNLNARKGFIEANAFLEELNNADYNGEMLCSFCEGFEDGLKGFCDGLVNAFAADGELSAQDFKNYYIMMALEQSDKEYTITQDDYNKMKEKYGEDNIIIVEQSNYGYKIKFKTNFNSLNAKVSYKVGNGIGGVAVPMITAIAVNAIITAMNPVEGAATIALTSELTLTWGGIASASLMALSSFGNSREQAMQNGVDPWKAALYGGIKGLSEGAMELFLGGIPGISAGNKMLEGLVGKQLANMIGEGLEEMTEDFFDSVLRTFILGEDFEFDPDEMLKSGFYGFLIAGILSGGELVINKSANITINIENVLETVGENIEYILMAEKAGIELDYTKLTDPDYINTLITDVKMDNLNRFIDANEHGIVEIYKDHKGYGTNDIKSAIVKKYNEIYSTSYIDTDFEILQRNHPEIVENIAVELYKSRVVNYNMSWDIQKAVGIIYDSFHDDGDFNKLSDAEKQEIINSPDYAIEVAGLKQSLTAKYELIAENTIGRILSLYNVGAIKEGISVADVITMLEDNVPQTEYLTKNYIDGYLSNFNVSADGKIKVATFQNGNGFNFTNPKANGNLGRSEGMCSMPLEYAQQILNECTTSDGKISADLLTQKLGGVQMSEDIILIVVEVDIEDAFMPMGGMEGAFIGEWQPGGYTSGGIPEIMIPQRMYNDSSVIGITPYGGRTIDYYYSKLPSSGS